MNDSVSFEGVLITLLEYHKNKEFVCEKDCYQKRDCNIKRFFALEKPIVGKITATELIVEILNVMDSPWKASCGQWSIVDTSSYAYDCLSFCSELQNPRHKNLNYEVMIQPNTTIRTALYFPEIESNVGISSLICSNRKNSAKILINPLTQAAVSKIEEHATQVDAQSIISGDQSLIINNNIFELERLCKSRIAQTNSRDGERIEQKVNDKVFELEQQSRGYPNGTKLAVNNMIASILEDYNAMLVAVKQRESVAKKWNEQVEQLYEMEPRDFEVWTADLFEALGYTVKLTPQSNDHGVDVLCYKENKTIAVQCKKYKGVVGSPDIQKFMGAMVNAKADIGYFITTGTFSVSAEKFAKDANIVLYDKINLKELINIALNN